MAASILVNTMTPAPALPTPEAIPASLQDEQAVTAVREGDIARYRELVERYQRRVYAVAWSRLGDAALAEEATQEAFIRAYRSLPLLGDGAKFSAWISAIARNLSVSLGLRHRRELNKRARWALEQPTIEAPVSQEEPVCTPELLRQTLAELAPSHRECLVLFYLEDKSGAEAANTLGISESALRVRLMRARSALREKLETRLGESLAQLRPSSTLASSVMGVITTTSSAKSAAGAGLGSTIMAMIGKILPFKMVALFTPFISMLPGLGMAWWMRRAEQHNYREPEGFRARLHRDFFRRMIWFIGAMLVGSALFGHLGIHLIGAHPLFIGLGLFSLVMLGLGVRSLEINRSWFKIGIFFNTLCSTVGILAVGLGWMPITLFPFVVIAGSLVLIPTMRGRPLRMDYSLFLRAAQGMLPPPIEAERTATHLAGYSSPQLLAFARFMGGQFLVINHRWAGSGLQLCLPDVKFKRMYFSYLADFFTLRWIHASWVELRWDGTVYAHYGDRDESSLQEMDAPANGTRAELEARVATALTAAWSHFRAGDLAAAERFLGHVPDAEVFITPPTRSRGYYYWAGFMLITVFTLVYFSLKIGRLLHSFEDTRPLSDRVHAILDNEYQESLHINQLREPINKLSDQARSLEQEAQSAEPAQAAEQRQQADQLYQQINQALAQIDQINQHQTQEHAEIARIQKQINEMLNIPAPASAASPQR